MRNKTLIFSFAAAIAAATAGPAVAGDAVHRGDTVTPLFDQAIPNLPGKHLVGIRVDYQPGGYSGPHTHATSAFIHAYVLTGAVRSQVEGEAAHVYRQGQSWFESPGAHHLVSANASTTAPASLLVTFVADGNDTPLTTPDPK